ncbi:hypothetical protein VPH35_026208 [Triticum aestivum]
MVAPPRGWIWAGSCRPRGTTRSPSQAGGTLGWKRRTSGVGSRRGRCGSRRTRRGSCAWCARHARGRTASTSCPAASRRSTPRHSYGSWPRSTCNMLYRFSCTPFSSLASDRLPINLPPSTQQQLCRHNVATIQTNRLIT